MLDKFKSIMKIFLSIAFLTLPIIPVAIGAANIVKAYEEVVESGFIYEDLNSNKFICYPLSDTNGVSIGWANPDAHTPNNLEIPSQVTYQGNTYTVRAITTSGFHGCNFESVTIPQTVEEIKKEAFLTCTKLLEVQLPYLIEEIPSSCFMDCRNLRRVIYSDSLGNPTSVNTKITKIGDHAFTSCVKLHRISCPESIVNIEHSAFQGCLDLTSFFFPANPLSIGKFAFSDCAKLTVVYIDKTILNIDDYAFSDSNTNLTIYTNAKNASNLNFNGSADKWKYKYLTTRETTTFTVKYNQAAMVSDFNFPDLIFQINTSAAAINSSLNGNYALDSVKERFATIFGYTCYDLDSENLTINGYLTIPDRVMDEEGNIFTVKVLASRCFSNHEELKGVTFNSNLVQIMDYAFENSVNIESFNFDNCQKLKEVGTYAFGTTTTLDNTVCTNIKLPNSLEIIKSNAFRNFTHVNSLSFKTNESLCSNLKIIDENAFRRLGYALTESEATCDVLLPCSLNDVDAQFIRKNTTFSAIYNNVFYDSRALRNVTMETCEHNIASHIDNDESFGSGVFYNCLYLQNFTSSEQLYRMGNTMFFGDHILKDIKLHSQRAWINTVDCQGNPVVDYPWGNSKIRDTKNCMFDYAPDAVIYIKEGLGNSLSTLFNHEANTTNSYSVSYGADAAYATYRGEISRSCIPTYANCDWENGELEKLNVSGGELSIVKRGSGGSAYGIITRFRGVATNYQIDLSNLTSYPIKEIGDSAFASINETDSLQKVILPSTLEYIGERAFFQPYSANGTYNKNIHLKIVTYKNNGSEVLPSNSAYNSYYCILPDSVHHIGNFAFLSNAFMYIKFNMLDYFGINAFSVSPKGKTPFVINSQIQEFDVNDSSKIAFRNGGFYYVGDLNKKTLLYQQQNNANTELVIEAGTKAIGNLAISGCNITKLTLPAGLINIYPLGISGCFNLTEINGEGLESLEQLGYGYEDVDDFWTSDMPMDNYNFDNFSKSTFGGTRLLPNLRTMDMTKLYNLKSIGPYSFSDLKSLENMTNGVVYKFYKTTNGVINATPTESRSDYVMDLTNSTKLRRISRGAFRRENTLRYVIFPNSTNYDGTRESQMTFYYQGGGDSSSEMFPNTDKLNTIMIGETAFQAYANNNALNASKHYEIGYLGSKNPYYFANSLSDLDTEHSSLKYWTFKGGSKETREYILFETLAEARAYFRNI